MPFQTNDAQRSRDWQIAILIVLGSWLILACTAPGIPVVWDEGEYLARADRIVTWFGLLVHGGAYGGRHALSATVIRKYWLFINHAEGHPAWFAIPIALSTHLLRGRFDPLTAARLGPITVFSIACGGVALRLRQNYGTVAGLVAVIALLTFPRLFSEAHFAAQDGQLTAWWLLLWVADSSRQPRLRSRLGVGIVLGLTAATKFTGWLAWCPLIVSRAIRKDPTDRRALLLILPLALLTFYMVNPPLWHHPLTGLMTHFRLSLDRAHTFNIPIGFLGHIYDVQHPLPWYNTVAWLAMVTPVPTLVLGLIGLGHCLRTRAPISVALVLHWATLMVIRALPGAPPHDGIRLFLPAFGFWCVFAGIGAQRVWDAAARLNVGMWWERIVRTAVVAALAATAMNLTRYYPQTLSHYSLLVGGVRGAASIGMEPAYWWDALDSEALSWISEHSEPAAAIAFSPISNVTLLRDWGRLRIRDVDPHTDIFKWYVLQNRTGMLTAIDRALIRSATPAYTKYAGRRTAADSVPRDLQVPLILIFSYDQYLQAASSSGHD